MFYLGLLIIGERLYSRLLGVQLDDELFLDRFGDILSFGVVQELTAHGGTVPFQPVVAIGSAGQRIGNDFQRFGPFAHLHHIAGFELIGGNVHDIAVYHDVTVAYQLAGRATRRGDAETVNRIVQTGFDKLQQYLAGNTGLAGGLMENLTELFFQDTVGVFSLLFFLQLNAVFGLFAAAFVGTVLARRIVLSLQNLVRAENRFLELSCYF